MKLLRLQADGTNKSAKTKFKLLRRLGIQSDERLELGDTKVKRTVSAVRSLFWGKFNLSKFLQKSEKVLRRIEQVYNRKVFGWKNGLRQRSIVVNFQKIWERTSNSIMENVNKNIPMYNGKNLKQSHSVHKLIFNWHQSTKKMKFVRNRYSKIINSYLGNKIETQTKPSTNLPPLCVYWCTILKQKTFEQKIYLESTLSRCKPHNPGDAQPKPELMVDFYANL